MSGYIARVSDLAARNIRPTNARTGRCASEHGAIIYQWHSAGKACAVRRLSWNIITHGKTTKREKRYTSGLVVLWLVVG